MLPEQFHGFGVSAMLDVFSCLGKVHTSIYNIINQAVIETVSHPAVAENQAVEPDVVTYQSYIPLWTGLLATRNTTVRRQVFEAFLNSLMANIEKLDLSVRHEENVLDPLPEEDMDFSLTQTLTGSCTKKNSSALLPSLGKRAVVVKDFTILVNLVDTSIHILDICRDLLDPWLPNLWEKVSIWSYGNQDVSSFYKLANSLLQLSFKDKKLDENSELYTLVRHFLEDHLQKCLNFDQSELRLVGFRLVTSIPVDLVPCLADFLPQTLDQILALGAEVPELANAALHSVRSYTRTLPEKSLDRLLRVVLPRLATFLAYSTKEMDSLEVKKTKRVYGKRKKRGKLHMSGMKFEEENCQLAMDILCQVLLII